MQGLKEGQPPQGPPPSPAPASSVRGPQQDKGSDVREKGTSLLEGGVAGEEKAGRLLQPEPVPSHPVMCPHVS